MRPNLLDELFAYPEADDRTDEERDADDARTHAMLEDLWHMFGFLPDDEQLILRLKLTGKTQVQIAEILRVGQPAISYRIAKATRRLRWLAECGYAEISGPSITRDLTGVAGIEPPDVLLLRSYFELRQGAAAGRTQGIHPPRTFRRLSRLVAVLAAVPELRAYHRVFEAMLREPQILQTWPGPRRDHSAAVEKVSIAALLGDEPTPTPKRKTDP
jgi:hypothetical protein